MTDVLPPELITFSQFGGNWSSYVETIYKYYLSEVVNARLTYRDLPIRCQFRPAYDGKGFAFWHVISEGEKEEERTPDLRRCERIRWIAWVINHTKNEGINNKISWWENKRKSNTHVVLFFEEENYVVVLAKRTGYYLLKTTYCVELRRKTQLIRERNEYWSFKKTESAC